ETVREADAGGDRGQVENRAPASFHGRYDRFHAVVDALHVHGVQPVEVFLRGLLDVAHVRDPGAVHEDVRGTEVLVDGLKDAEYVGRAAHVAAERSAVGDVHDADARPGARAPPRARAP